MTAPSSRRAVSGLGGLVLIVLLAACSSSPGGAVSTTAPAATGVVVNMATTSLGPVLTGPNGLTLYTHTGDSATASTCTGTCATTWPPLAVAAGGQATGGAGVTGTFGTLTRADGTIQVTYNGLPLYGWQSDTKAGDVTGQGIEGFTVATPGSAPAPGPTGTPGAVPTY